MNSYPHVANKTGPRKKKEADGSRCESTFSAIAAFPGAALFQKKGGNHAVLNYLRSSALQARLTVSQPDDSYEQEADRVADQVMRMPDAEIGRQLSEVSKQNGMIQTKPG